MPVVLLLSALLSPPVDAVPLPFQADPALVGHWRLHDYLLAREAFQPEGPADLGTFMVQRWTTNRPALARMETRADGSTSFGWRWTRGRFLDPSTWAASPYEIATIGTRTFLFVTWVEAEALRGLRPPHVVVFERIPTSNEIQSHHTPESS